MRGGFGLLRKPSCIGSSRGSGIPTATRITSLSAFSTSSSGGGSGRGRGRGINTPSPFAFVANQPDRQDADTEDPDSRSAASPGAGHGRGKTPVTMPSSPFRPSMTQQPQPTHGRGSRIHPPAESGQQPQQKTTKPFFFVQADDSGQGAIPVMDPIPPRPKPIGEANLPESLMSVLGGTGRGKPGKSLGPAAPVAAKQENRHLRRRQIGVPTEDGAPAAKAPTGGQPKLSREEAKKKAMGILTKDGEGREEAVGGRGRGRRGRGRGRGRGERDGDWEDRDYRQGSDNDGEEEEDDMHPGDDADGEKLAKKLGPQMMEKLTEAFEDVANEVLPDVLWDEYVDAYDTNLQFEFEPQYAMGDFESNPDIDDKDPVPLREALEKVKPFLMTYEGIQNEEEWQEAIEDTMKRAPLLEKIVEHYSGPERVTAKQQQEELERVAKTLPASAPDPLKRFTDRAVLSLQSNPGWGFHRKCQFMDKLVWEASQSYK